jgi:hypothetical protein
MSTQQSPFILVPCKNVYPCLYINKRYFCMSSGFLIKLDALRGKNINVRVWELLVRQCVHLPEVIRLQSATQQRSN